jgi:glycosyltransferase involved in cell wall biosynthesis
VNAAPPRLSLCLVVRDEAAMLPEFLRRVSPLADEICAVDTGSTDGTPALLRAAGARLVLAPWTGDFAAARNASLDLATGDFVLVLDPDERPGPDFVAECRALLLRPELGAATVLLRNTFDHGQFRDSRLLRLFRRDPSIRYRHRIHEDASESVAALLRARGLLLLPLHAPVEHLGYRRERAASKDKKARDAAILRRCIEEDPDDAYSRFKLLELARFWDDGAMASTAARECLEFLRNRGDSPSVASTLRAAPWAGELSVLLARALHPGEPAAALELLDAASLRITRSPAFHLGRGEVRELAGDVAGARVDFEACLAFGSDPSLQLVLTRPLLGLARLDLAAGNPDAARTHAEAALLASPRDPEALLAAATLHIDEIPMFIAEYTQRHGDSPELHEAAGEALLLHRRPSAAVAPLVRAAGEPPRGRVALRLAQAQLLSSAPAPAERTLRALLPALPEAGIGLLVCDLLAGRDSKLELDLGQEEADAALLSWVKALTEGPDRALPQRFSQRAPALYPAFPWLRELIEGPPG